MKVRDSGMPEREYWESLLDVAGTLDRFNLSQYRDVAELGCGYGTFSLPVARTIAGTLYAFDIEPDMVATTQQRLRGSSAKCEVRDVLKHGFGVKVDAVLLFNILHCENPIQLLRMAVQAAPAVLVTHWIFGETPRGPSLHIRPRPEHVAQWAKQVGLDTIETFNLPPWHFGMKLVSGAGQSRSD